MFMRHRGMYLKCISSVSYLICEGELEGIAVKFLEAKIKGEIFIEVTHDKESLVEIGLSVGEAMLFIQSMNKLNDNDKMKPLSHHIETAMLESASSSSIESEGNCPQVEFYEDNVED